MVTLQNYEEYIMLYVDNELDAASVKALMDFLEEHPELKKELALYQKTKLSIEDELLFADKEQLLRKPVKTISFNRWMLYGIAASLVLLIGLATIKWNNKPENTNIHTPEIANKTDSVIPASQHTAKSDDTQAAPSATILTEEKPSKPIAKTKTKAPVKNNAEQQHLPIQQPDIAPENAPATQPEETVQLAKADEPQENEKEMRTEEVNNIHIPEPSAPAKTKTKKGLLALLPISSEKKQGLNHLKNTVEEKVETVKGLQEELKNTSFEVRLGNKELFVINL